MKQKNRALFLQDEIKRVSKIIQTTESEYLRRDMAKYLKRLKKEVRFGITKKP